MLDPNFDGLKEVLSEYWNFAIQKYNHSNYRIPELAWDRNFQVELAQTQADLEAVFRLQHESYVSRGLMKAHPSGLRCNIFHFLPQTNHVTVKYKGVVIASVTLVADSPLGLPADKHFSGEIDALRVQGQKIVELSSFVVDRGFKASSKVLTHLLMKYSLNYVRRFMECSQIVVNVHPSMVNFYATNWYFQQKSEVIKFHSSKSAYTTMMTHVISREYRKYFMRSFPSLHVTKNAATFILKHDPRFHYPLRSAGQVVLPTMTPELLEYFFIQKTNLYEDLDLNTRQIFLEMYLQFFGEEEIGRFLNLERELTLKEFRIPVSTRVAIRAGSQLFIGRVRDITTSGCFIEVPLEIKEQNEPLVLSFRIGESQLQVRGFLSWRNVNRQIRYGHGYGIRFENQVEELKLEIRNWLPLRKAA